MRNNAFHHRVELVSHKVKTIYSKNKILILLENLKTIVGNIKVCINFSNNLQYCLFYEEN